MSKTNGQTAIDGDLVAMGIVRKPFPLRPLHSMLFIKPDAPEDVSVGGIIIPDSVKERPNKGTVMALGEDLAGKPIKLGDKVFHVKGGGLEYEVKGEIYVQIRYSDCLCIDE